MTHTPAIFGQTCDALELPYEHPLVRDLAWVMRSPGLLRTGGQASVAPGDQLVSDEWCHQLYVAHQAQLQALDENPQPLQDALAHCKSHRLGIYFECLLAYWLKHIVCVQQLQHNVPVFQAQTSAGRKTLGEFDFLFRLANRPALQHWEVTVKFYLQQTDAEGTVRWVGPGDRDRFDIKLERLFTHQLQLAAHAAHLFAKNENIHPAAFVKGYLFYPLNEKGEFIVNNTAIPVSDQLPYVPSDNHCQGWWIRWGQSFIPQQKIGSRWMILQKSRWLSPMRYVGDADVLLDEKGLAAHCETAFQHERRAILVAELYAEQGVWREVSRGFIVAPG